MRADGAWADSLLGCAAEIVTVPSDPNERNCGGIFAVRSHRGIEVMSVDDCGR